VWLKCKGGPAMQLQPTVLRPRAAIGSNAEHVLQDVVGPAECGVRKCGWVYPYVRPMGSACPWSWQQVELLVPGGPYTCGLAGAGAGQNHEGVSVVT
jgi:hypothetical protein